MKSEFVSVTEAARLLGCNVNSLRAGLINGTFPFGLAWNSKTETRAGQWNFRIPRKALMNFLENGLIKENAPDGGNRTGA